MRRLLASAIAGWLLMSCAMSTALRADELTKVALGLIGAPDTERDGPMSLKTAKDLRLNFVVAQTRWIEPKPDQYAWSGAGKRSGFRERLKRWKKNGFTVSISYTNVFMDHKHLPKYLKGKRFNDAYLIERWEKHLRAFLARYGDYVDYLNFGLEVNNYFSKHRDEWRDYQPFFRKGVAVTRELKPKIKIGIVVEAAHIQPYWRDVKPHCDHLGITYYMPCSVFAKSPTSDGLDPNHPKYFAHALNRAVRAAGDKTIFIREIGCATHKAVDSSPKLQAQFVKALFKWLRENEQSVTAMEFQCIRDWNYEGTKVALKGYLDGGLLKHKKFLRYLTSLGLQYEDGSKKPAYDVFQSEVVKYRRLPAGRTKSAPVSEGLVLDGTWVLKSFEVAGKKVAGLEGAKLVMSKGKKTFTMNDGTVEVGAYRIDAEKKIIDTTTIGKNEDGKGIYVIEKGKLSICISPSGAKRPKTLKTEVGTDLMLLVFERATD